MLTIYMKSRRNAAPTTADCAAGCRLRITGGEWSRTAPRRVFSFRGRLVDVPHREAMTPARSTYEDLYLAFDPDRA